MRSAAIWLACASACGRLGFEPPADSDNDSNGDVGTGDGTTRGDGATGGGDGATVSGSGDVCADAIPLTPGVATNGSVAMAADDYSGAGCGNGIEIVFRFDSPTARLRAFDVSLQFQGAMRIDPVCPPSVGSCQGFSGNASGTTMFAQGANYIFIDRTSGTGTTMSITVY